MAQERAQIPIEIREDELPPIPLESYIPCTPSELNVLRSFLPNSISVEILGDLIEYEMMGPPGLTGLEWLERRELCRYLKYPEPGPRDAMQHFVTDNSLRMGAILFDNERDNGLWSIDACLNFAHCDHWTHKASGTAVGGPLGCKWPLFMLALLSLNDGFTRVDPTTPGVPKGLPKEALAKIEDLEQHWKNLVLDSVKILHASLEERTQVGNESLAAFRPADLDAGDEDLEIIETPRSENEWEANDSEPQGYKSMSEQSSERSVVSSQGRQKSVIRSTRRKRTSGGGTPKAKHARSGQNESSEDKEGMYSDDEESADTSAESTRRADRKAGRNTRTRAARRSNSRKIPTTPGSSESEADDADSGDEIASAPVHLYDALRFGMKLDLEALHILHTRQTSVTYVDEPLTFEIRARFQSDGYMATGYLLEKVD
ncbi:hypothetical protein BDV93DRAFT_565603 [Ceratobasidium sp. AG-I]|nr:hypothetical protein BDV93DRAFT_565603 [Ceratobasidium sp. AG-I]